MAKTSNKEVISTAKGTTKASVAREIFDAAYQAGPVPARKEILELVVAAANLSAKGAATYLQNYKRKAGLIGRGATA